MTNYHCAFTGSIGPKAIFTEILSSFEKLATSEYFENRTNIIIYKEGCRLSNDVFKVLSESTPLRMKNELIWQSDFCEMDYVTKLVFRKENTENGTPVYHVKIVQHGGKCFIFANVSDNSFTFRFDSEEISD